MKSRKLTLVAGLIAALGFSGQAAALLPSTTPDLVINISGASAQKNPLGELLGSFCAAGTLTTYNPASGNSWRSYYCTIDASTNAAVPASLDGLNVLFNNRSAGGSIWGVVPVARTWAVEYMNIFSGNCTGTSTDQSCVVANRADGLVPFAASSSGFECPFVPYAADATEVYTTTSGASIFAHTGTTADDTVCLKSDGGVSDVEPALFSATENFPGFTGGPLSAAELGSITVLSEYGVIFGLSITDNAFRHLQNIQYPGTYTNVFDTVGEPTDQTDALRPSLPKTAIRSLMTGQLQSFQALDQAIAPPTGGPAGFMAVCRRVVGSGTQAAANAQFMNNPCLGSSAKSMVSDPDGGGAPQFVASQLVKNNSGSGDVETCQNNAASGALAVEAGFSSIPLDAIGINAINRNNSGDDWRFVKIDGIDPTVDNAVAGLYNHVYEQTLQFPAASSSIVTDALTMVAVASGDPDTIANTPISGVMALSGNGFDWETTTPTWRGGRGGDSCSDITLQPDAP